MRSRVRVSIIYEPFEHPEMPFGIYELVSMQNGWETYGQELARARSREEAIQLARRFGWEIYH
jgi:hypothetical protein